MGQVLEHPQDGLLRFSISRLSKETGMARETIASRIEANGIKPDGKGTTGRDTYLLRDVGPAIYAHNKPISIVENPAELPPKERKDWYDSEKKRLEVEAAQGVLVPVHDFQQEVAAICKTVAQFLETLPDILERDCGLDPATIDRVQQSADLQRTELADRLDELEV